MKHDIEYGRDLIVGVVRAGNFYWYASEKEQWVLDQQKWKAVFSNSGFATPEGFGDRFGIGVVNEVTSDRFLSCMEPDLITTDELRAMLERKDTSDADDVCHLIPGLFVDFDSKTLVSHFPEPLEYERFAPAGWAAYYGEFFDRIPIEHRYWMRGGRSVFIHY